MEHYLEKEIDGCLLSTKNLRKKSKKIKKKHVGT